MSDEAPRMTGGSVLIVDDDRSMAETLAKAMTRRGFAVATRTSASEALQALEHQAFDVVVTELHMDGTNGNALCERIVANRPDLPVIMITPFGSLESALGAIRVGAYDVVIKPFDVETLRLTLTRAIEHRQLRAEVTQLRQVVSEARDLVVLGIGPGEALTMDELERRYVIRVLAQVDGNKTIAAQLLGLDRRTLYRKLERWDARGA
jgi:two-component system response regulator AtoC